MRIENLIVFIYGDPGIGKTSLAFSAKNPILFDFDAGAHRSGKFRKDTVPVKQWADVANISADDLAGYDTIIIDTAGRMLDVIIAELVKDQKNCRKNSKELSIQGYGTLNKRFTSWLNLMRSFNKDVVLLAHSAEDKKGDDVIVRPDMVGGSKKEAYKVADMMGYMTTIQGRDGAEKLISFAPSASHHAKDSGAIGNISLPNLDNVSVTMLDTYVSGMQNDDISSEELAQQLFGEFTPSPAMAAGTAFHELLELGIPANLAINDYRFTLPNDLDGILELGSVRERKYTWEILPEVVLVGKIDAETAFKVIDHKLTAQFDQDRYMDSLQWRAYLAMRKKCHFAYQVFEHAGLPAVPNEHGLYEVLIKKYHVLEQFAYKGMAEEVKEVAYDLAEFARVWKPIIRSVPA